jgi:cellulose biosynthesis protein BcsQ
MLIACWSVKGGSGTSTVAAALAIRLAQRQRTLLVDLCGDQPALLGLTEPSGPGFWDLARLGATSPGDAVARLEIPVAEQLSLLAAGEDVDGSSTGTPTRTDVSHVGRLLAADPRAVVLDCGVVGTGPAAVLAAEATRSLLVIRPCYLALRRAAPIVIRPSGVVIVREVGRALGAADVAAVIGAPIVAEIDVDPALARTIDAGLLVARLPRRVSQALRHAA